MHPFGWLAATQPVAHAVLMLATVIVTGLALGALKVRQIGLGTAGVLFAGIVFGHFGERVDHAILDFVKEFGLILFVFTIGLQLGPGFFAALQRQGLRLNALAVSIVSLGALTAVAVGWLLGIDAPAALGLLAGASTNTPSLGAIEQALNTLPDVGDARAALPALGYAVAYPAGIAGILGSMLVPRAIFRVDVGRELERFRSDQRSGAEPLDRLNVVVENRNLDGQPLGQVPGRRESGVIVSGIRRTAAVGPEPALDETILHLGDTLHLVGTRHGLSQFLRVVGRPSDIDLLTVAGSVKHRPVVVTSRQVLGRSIEELGFDQLYRVALSRVTRGDVEMTAVPDLRLQFGDVVRVIGEPQNIERAATALGDSVRALNETQFVPLFIGIALGVLAGVTPIAVPGMPVGIRLGLAGGPLMVAILLARLGHFRGLVWHMPMNANLAFRELGITLFLACVGLKAGEHFFATVFTANGVIWFGAAAGITVVPLIAVGAFARTVLKLDFLTLSGLLAGSTTDPPALAFAGALAQSDAPSVAYATVYPLTMLLRILTAQALTLILCS